MTKQMSINSLNEHELMPNLKMGKWEQRLFGAGKELQWQEKFEIYVDGEHISMKSC